MIQSFLWGGSKSFKTYKRLDYSYIKEYIKTDHAQSGKFFFGQDTKTLLESSETQHLCLTGQVVHTQKPKVVVHHIQ